MLRVWSTPEGALLKVDGRASGQAPAFLELPAGNLGLELSKPGYAPWASTFVLAAGGTLSVTGTLRDVARPAVQMTGLPARSELGERLLIEASADDNEAVSSLALWIDGQQRAKTRGEPLSYLWDTGADGPGVHVLRLEARDPVGNVGRAETRVELSAPGSPAPRPTAGELPSPTRAAPDARKVAVSQGWVTIPTYQYRRALRGDPASPAYPYPVLDHLQVGPPLPATYETIVLQNEYLRLVFLPALGGRLYQCIVLSSGQNVLYNNPVLKPSHWGPPEMGWWLAAGGMEWCLPVDEHGYVSAEPWTAQTSHAPDGSATIVLAHTEQTRNVRVAVAVTLPPGQASFAVTSRLENPDAQPKTLQYWLNAMVSLGNASLSPATQFLLPASQVIVHSSGDAALGAAHSPLPWPIADGRDLRRYGNWRDWLGVFAPAVTAGYMGAYSLDSDLGIVRLFPADRAPGVKLFAFGRGFDDAASYTDDGSQYAELWGGLTATFWDWATLPAHGSVQWTETWFPVRGLGGLSAASADAALLAEWDGQDLQVGVVTPRPRNLVVSIFDADGELYRQAAAAGPGRPFVATVRPGRAVAGSLIVRVLGEANDLLAEHVVGPR